MRQTAPTPTPSPELEARFEEFGRNLSPGQISLELFETLPDVMFWVKDTESRYIYVNKAFADVLNSTPVQLLGRSDSDYYAPELVRVFHKDDQTVMATREPISNKTELVTRAVGGIEWHMTTKIPVIDRNDEVIGTAGISRRLAQHDGHPLPAPYRALSQMVDYVHQHVDDNVSVEELAEKSGMSVSTLERRFRSTLGTTPKRFIVHAKIAAACERLVTTAMSVNEIAESVGYHEHASFTRTFTKIMHMSPTAYRKHYQMKG